ncbi:MAG TPA: MFS transporter [Verrucomicrobiae bacterium]|jgi:FHS family L-fucose permease-like MFS transporter
MTNSGTSTISTSASSSNGQSYRGPFAIMTVLFFMWGFITVMNDILIPRLQDAFVLTNYQIMFVQGYFFGAYFVGSLIYFIISAKAGDPIAKIGYKNGVVIGLLIAALGSSLFWPAATLAPRFSIVTQENFKNFPALAQKLTQQNDAVSTYIYNNLSVSTQQALKQSPSSADSQTVLAQDLTKIIDGPLIYDAQRFSAVKVLPTTTPLLSQNLQGQALAALNRELVTEAYPDYIEKNMLPFWICLAALFIVALGLAMLQIAANPYVTILGPERTASSRLNLAQAFNSVGTTIGPLIGGYLIFQYFAKAGLSGTDSVKVPYLLFCSAFLVLAVIFFFLHLPHVGEGKIEPGAGALKHPHVILGFLAIFMYVGGEVSIGSNIIKFLGEHNIANMSAIEASKYVSLFWGGMLIGRFTGAIELSEIPKAKKMLLLIIVPLLAYLFLWAAISAPLDALHGGASFSDVLGQWKDKFTGNWDMFKIYFIFLVLCWFMFQFGKALPGRTLVIFCSTIIALLLVAIFVGGKTAMWCIVAVGLFTSIGWPNIFSLALDGMGNYKSQVSSLLVMGVLGGGVLPLLMGKFADHWSRQYSFIIPLAAYAYVGFYGLVGHKIGRGRQPVPA